MTDRYARLYHNCTSLIDCSDYAVGEKPIECYEGADDAQNSACIENVISSICTFVTASYFGSISDMYGRKTILVLSMILCTIRPIIFVLMQLDDTLQPIYYYIASGISGLFNWMALSLSCISDVMPQKWRAPCFGLLMASFSLGVAISPVIAIPLGHFQVSLFSLAIALMAVGISLFCLPETVSYEAIQSARRNHQIHRHSVMSFFHPEYRMITISSFSSTSSLDYITQNSHDDSDEEDVFSRLDPIQTDPIVPSWKDAILWNICYRPIWEISILNRNCLFRLLSLLAFFSGMVLAGE
jgi:MFS family permease